MIFERALVEQTVLDLLVTNGFERAELFHRLEQDLQVRGKELKSIFRALEYQFNIDMTGLDFARFFHEDPPGWRGFTFYLRRFVAGNDVTDREECRVANLVDICCIGYWIDPVQPSRIEWVPVPRESAKRRVLDLFAQAGCQDINLSDRIEQDLKVRGDDLWPIIIALHDEFGVNFKPLNYDRFFHGEYFRLRDVLWLLFRKVSGREITDREECTVDHLIDVVGKGYWFDPVH